MAFSVEINTEFGIALTALSVDTITLFIASSTVKKNSNLEEEKQRHYNLVTVFKTGLQQWEIETKGGSRQNEHQPCGKSTALGIPALRTAAPALGLSASLPPAESTHFCHRRHNHLCLLWTLSQLREHQEKGSRIHMTDLLFLRYLI